MIIWLLRHQSICLIKVSNNSFVPPTLTWEVCLFAAIYIRCYLYTPSLRSIEALLGPKGHLLLLLLYVSNVLILLVVHRSITIRALSIIANARVSLGRYYMSVLSYATDIGCPHCPSCPSMRVV